MKQRDDGTIGFYAREAAAYTTRSVTASDQWLGLFLSRIARQGKILELGCGAGQDSEAMIAAGFDVTPTDGTPEIATAARKRLGVPVKVLLFEDIAESQAYDGVWANACLLHVPREALPSIFAKVHTALRPGGTFYASFKEGEQEGRDGLGRFYNYPDADFLTTALGSDVWSGIEVTSQAGTGYDQLPTDWLHVIAVKSY